MVLQPYWDSLRCEQCHQGEGTSEILYLLTAKPEAFFHCQYWLSTKVTWHHTFLEKNTILSLKVTIQDILSSSDWAMDRSNEILKLKLQYIYIYILCVHILPLGGSTTSCRHTIISSLSWHGLLVSKQFIQQTPWMCSLDVEPSFQFSPVVTCGDFA